MNTVLGLTTLGGVTISLLKRARARASFSSFFPSSFPSALAEQQHKRVATDKIIFAVGNEAGDLDSIVSSIGIAWLYNALDTTDATRVVPLIPFPRNEFRLRRDVVYLFHLVGFHLNPTDESPQQLVFIDEVDAFLQQQQYYTAVPSFEQFQKMTGTAAAAGKDPCIELILTDHNKNTLTHSSLTTATVIEIVDHHTDSGDHSSVQGNKRNIVGGLGSACTLVAELLLDAEHQKLCTLPIELTTLLMATIVLDSRQWSPVKSTLRDQTGTKMVWWWWWWWWWCCCCCCCCCCLDVPRTNYFFVSTNTI